jgi:hypothetical protein
MRCKRFASRFAGAGALVGAALALAPGALAGGSYTDPGGDSNGAPDIQNVAVSSDSSGQIQIVVKFNGAFTTGAVMVFLDTDMNQATGAPRSAGADYVLYESQTEWDFAGWNGNSWDDTIPYSTASVDANADMAIFSVNRSELGNTSEFNFWVRTVTDDAASDAVDTAPDLAVWNFSTQAQGPDLAGVLYKQTPLTGPTHARSFTVTPIGVKVTPSAQGAVVPAPDSYTCRAVLAGKAISGTGDGGCTWKLPKNAKGKTLVVSITVMYEGASLTIRQAYKVG